MRSARTKAIDAAMASMEEVKKNLKLVSNQDSQPPDKAESEKVRLFFKGMGEMRGTMVETKKKVNEWKGPPKARKSNAPAQRPNKRPRVTTEDVVEEPVQGAMVGSPEFREEVKRSISEREGTMEEWYDYVTMGNPGTIFNLASTGLLVVAVGVEETEIRLMMSTLAELLAPEALELQVFASVQNASIGKINPEVLSRFYKESHDPYHATNKSSRVALLQHIAMGVKALQWSIAWSEIKKGSKYQNGRGKVVEDMYLADCEAKGQPIDPEFKDTDEYKTYAGVKDYNTGANRFLAAYKEVRSILLLCPLLNIFRFTNSALGPKVAKAITEMIEDDTEGKLKSREPNHL
ncbi:hypothetical protein RSAG8_11061, partial [Rhizoctonia solani AG-8 WAC10335]